MKTRFDTEVKANLGMAYLPVNISDQEVEMQPTLLQHLIDLYITVSDPKSNLYISSSIVQTGL